MTKGEALKAMEAGHKVTLRQFSDDEYLHMVDGVITSEEGYNFEDWWEENVDWRRDGWSIYKEN